MLRSSQQARLRLASPILLLTSRTDKKSAQLWLMYSLTTGSSGFCDCLQRLVVVAMSSERRLALPLLLGLLWCVTECKWHPGCLCELKETPSASDFSMASIFGTSLFRSGGKVAQFCPCSVETVQQLNRELIAPRLFTLLNRTFFRYARVDLERSCAFWNDEAGSCALRDCAVEACSADEELRLESCDETSSLSRVTRASESALGKEAPSWEFQKIKYSMADWTNLYDEVDGEGGFGEGDGEVSGAGSGRGNSQSRT